jgi:hypothetical protein
MIDLIVFEEVAQRRGSRPPHLSLRAPKPRESPQARGAKQLRLSRPNWRNRAPICQSAVWTNFIRDGAEKIEHRTSNAQHPTSKAENASRTRFRFRCWMFDVGRWMFSAAGILI